VVFEGDIQAAESDAQSRRAEAEQSVMQSEMAQVEAHAKSTKSQIVNDAFTQFQINHIVPLYRQLAEAQVKLSNASNGMNVVKPIQESLKAANAEIDRLRKENTYAYNEVAPTVSDAIGNENINKKVKVGWDQFHKWK